MSTRMTVALTREEHLMSTRSARQYPGGQYRCLYCQCPLLVCGVAPYQSAYFPARRETLHRTSVTWWLGLLCHRHYYGNKRCSVCHSDDHSIQA